MKCTKCAHEETKVIESRDVNEGEAVRRRRECLECHQRFTTYERLEMPYLAVRKKDGTTELFDKTKILSGLTKACEKRPVNMMQLEEVAVDIERAAYARGEQEITTKVIGELVMDELMRLDDVAYVRFASVYRSFADLGSFEKELAKLKRRAAVDSPKPENVSSRTSEVRRTET